MAGILHPSFLRAALGAVLAILPLGAQQVADPDFRPALPRPAYAADRGPKVAVDGGHANFHTAGGRYAAFAELLRRDGYRVAGREGAFTAKGLREADVLVIANALHARNADDWSLPTPSAFTAEEIAAVQAWVRKGGALLLIVDHMPFPGAAGDLAAAFGFTFSNGYARNGRGTPGKPDVFAQGSGLEAGPLTTGRPGDEPVTAVATFTGSAFRVPKEARPVLVFGTGSESLETTKAPGISEGAPKVPIEGWSQGAVRRFGRGRVAVFGEAAMFTAQLAGPARNPMGMNAPDAAQNPRFLLNVLHWLSRAPGMPE